MRLRPRFASQTDSLFLDDTFAYKDFLRDAFRSKNKSVRKNLQGLERYQGAPLFSDPVLAGQMEKKAFQLSSEDYARLFHSLHSVAPPACS